MKRLNLMLLGMITLSAVSFGGLDLACEYGGSGSYANFYDGYTWAKWGNKGFQDPQKGLVGASETERKCKPAGGGGTVECVKKTTKGGEIVIRFVPDRGVYFFARDQNGREIEDRDKNGLLRSERLWIPVKFCQ